MADFEKVIPTILKHEGGFVNNPVDPGGATNRGIIFSLFKQYASALNMEPTVEALKTLTEDQAKFIYREHFWNPMQGDSFKDQQVAEIVFDAYVNAGRSGLRSFQKSVGVPADGEIGPYTLEILHQQNQKTVFYNFKEVRTMYYQDLVKRKPQLGVFLKGWMNRINSFNYKET